MRWFKLIPLSLVLPTQAVAFLPSRYFVTEAYKRGARVSVSESLGLAPLTAEDIDFIGKVATLIRNGTQARPHRRRDIDITYSQTADAWTNLGMDTWLDGYANQTWVMTADGRNSSMLLRDSKNFFADFWSSTGDQPRQEHACTSIIDQCVAVYNPELARKDLDADTLQRAYLARLQMEAWFTQSANSYQMLSLSSADSQSMISDLISGFKADTATKPTDPMDVFLPILGLATVFLPELAPVAGLIQGAVPLSKSLSSRDDRVRFKERQDDEESEENPIQGVTFPDSGRPAITPPTVGSTIQDLQDRITKLEEPAPEDWTKNVKARVKQGGDIMTNAAKVITAIKGLNPGLPKDSINDWTFYASRMKTITESFWQTTEQSFNMNRVVWVPTVSETTDGVQAGAVGMQALLYGGQWFAGYNKIDDVSSIRDKLKAFYGKMVFNEIMKSQATYLWRQGFDNGVDCNAVLQNYVDQKLVASVGNQCIEQSFNGWTWQLRIARMPYQNTGAAAIGDVKDQTLMQQHNKAIKLSQDDDSSRYLFQYPSDFQANTAGVTKWTDSDLSSGNIGLTTHQIFDYAEACQATGQNPFAQDQASHDTFYKPMDISGLNLITADKLPACLFDLPIIDINDDSMAQWCSDHLGSLQYGFEDSNSWGDDGDYGDSGMPIFLGNWKPDNNICVDFESWARQADAKICGDMTGPWRSGRVTQPGCKLHDQGVFAMDVA